MKILLRKTFTGAAYRIVFLTIAASSGIECIWAMQDAFNKAVALMNPGQERRSKSHHNLSKLEQEVQDLKHEWRQQQGRGKLIIRDLKAEVDELRRNQIFLTSQVEGDLILQERNLSENFKNNDQRLFQSNLLVYSFSFLLLCQLMWYAFPNQCGM